MSTTAIDTHGSLPAVLGVTTCGQLREGLLGLMATTAGAQGLPLELMIDAADVESVDAAGIQTLLALKAELAGTGRSLRLLTPSPALESALELIGLTPALTPSHGAV